MLLDSSLWRQAVKSLCSQTGSDPFYWLRVILASNRGTLMELGISPVLSADWMIHLAIILKIIKFDSSVMEDIDLMRGASKGT